VKIAWKAKVCAWLFPPDGSGSAAARRPLYERFALPHDFKPQLTLLDAVIAAGGAFLRIVLGSVLFAVWGAYSLTAWSAIRNPFLRVAALLSLFTAFLLSMAALLLAIAALVQTLLKRSRRS
jgi:hypothetical protein